MCLCGSSLLYLCLCLCETLSAVIVHSVIICSCVSWYCLHHLQERSGFVVFMFALILSICDLVLKIVMAWRLGRCIGGTR